MVLSLGVIVTGQSMKEPSGMKGMCHLLISVVVAWVKHT